MWPGHRGISKLSGDSHVEPGPIPITVTCSEEGGSARLRGGTAGRWAGVWGSRGAEGGGLCTSPPGVPLTTLPPSPRSSVYCLVSRPPLPAQPRASSAPAFSCSHRCQRTGVWLQPVVNNSSPEAQPVHELCAALGVYLPAPMLLPHGDTVTIPPFVGGWRRLRSGRCLTHLPPVRVSVHSTTASLNAQGRPRAQL